MTRDEALALKHGDRVERVDQIDEYGVVVAVGFGQVDIKWDVEHPELGRPFTERHDAGDMADIERVKEEQ